MYMRITCGSCGKPWEIYERDKWNVAASGSCPHCGAEIDAQTWTRSIAPAFGAAADANRELVKDHTGSRQPLFSVDFLADRPRIEPEPDRDACPLLAVLEEYGT